MRKDDLVMLNAGFEHVGLQSLSSAARFAKAVVTLYMFSNEDVLHLRHVLMALGNLALGFLSWCSDVHVSSELWPLHMSLPHLPWLS